MAYRRACWAPRRVWGELDFEHICDATTNWVCPNCHRPTCEKHRARLDPSICQVCRDAEPVNPSPSRDSGRGESYIRECAREGVTEDDAENLLGFDKD
jgi:hypothetical protein